MQLVQPAPRQALRWTLLCLILLAMMVAALWGANEIRLGRKVKRKAAEVKKLQDLENAHKPKAASELKAKRLVELNSLTGMPEEVFEWAKSELLRNLTTRDLRGEAGKLRLWLKLRGQSTETAKNLTAALEGQLMGWVGRGEAWSSISDLTDSWQPGKAIVITTGDRYAAMTLNLVRSIREVFNSKLPIYIYFAGEKDLKPDFRSVMLKFGATAVTDVRPLFGPELELSGWDVKPFAMLACPWTEVLLLDADTVLMQSPEVFFDDAGYKEIGALFFTDRILGGNHEEKKRWLESILPTPLSETARASLFYQKRTIYWQESGAVLIDKGRRLAGMLASCIINALPERDELHAHTHGEKEGYWLGFEMAAEPYSMMPTPAGSIGPRVIDYRDHTQRIQQKVCGKLAHYDRQGNLLWFNDGLVEDKNAPVATHHPAILRYTLMSWDWNGLCAKYDAESLKTPEVGDFSPVQHGPWPLGEAELELLNRMTRLYLLDPLDEKSSLHKADLVHSKRNILCALFYRLATAIHV